MKDTSHKSTHDLIYIKVQKQSEVAESGAVAARVEIKMEPEGVAITWGYMGTHRVFSYAYLHFHHEFQRIN